MEGLAKPPKRPVQLVLAAVSTEAPQDRRRGDLAQLDRHDDAQHVMHARGNQVSVDVAAEQRLDVLVGTVRFERETTRSLMLRIRGIRWIRAGTESRRPDREALRPGFATNRVGLNVGSVGHTPPGTWHRR